MLALKMYVKVTENNMDINVIRWQLSTCIKIKERVYASSHRLHLLTSRMYDLENLRHGHDVQQSRWHHTMANT